MKCLVETKPFLKWAGGKGKLLEQLQQYFPPELQLGQIQRYVEPFVGGGAVFFYIASLGKVESFFLSDINPELVLAYKTIQSNVENLIEILTQLEDNYLRLNDAKRKEYFYQVRSEFNGDRKQIDFETYNEAWVTRTAQLIFLNKTCFNGLFRVNSKGGFNVPPGRYKNPKICNQDNLKAVSHLLQNTEIHQGDFTKCKNFVNKETFIYFDPPYKPVSTTSNFTAYCKEVFDDAEQLRLRDYFDQLHQKGAKLMLSNSDPQTDFFDSLYADYQIKRIKANRFINSNVAKRGQINEVLIMNYQPD